MTSRRLFLALGSLVGVCTWSCAAPDSTLYVSGGSWQAPSSADPTSDAGTTGGGQTSGPGGTTPPPGSGDASSPPSTDAGSLGPEELFDALLPTFESTCGPCHVQGTSNAPPYLGGTDPYSTIKTYAGFIVATPQQSLLLTKGAHEGPALVNPLRASITSWLTAESIGAPKGAVTTSPFAVTDGSNQVDLSSLVPGAAITFTAATSGDYLDLTAIDFIAPASSTVTVTYPVFYVVPASGPQIQDNDFSNVNQTVAAGQTATLGPGTLSIEGWATGDQLRIAFKGLASSAGGGGSDDAGTTAPAGACKAVASFTANAVPVIAENDCITCHGAGGSGNGSLDLSPLALTPPDDITACANALAKVNLTNPAESAIILAPTGGILGHPFTTATADFAPAIETWIQAEQ